MDLADVARTWVAPKGLKVEIMFCPLQNARTIYQELANYIGESGHGSDGRIVRATQISQKCIKIGTPASMCIFSLDRCMFHPIMRLD